MQYPAEENFLGATGTQRGACMHGEGQDVPEERKASSGCSTVLSRHLWGCSVTKQTDSKVR